jgi:hypothetical protein
VTTFYAYPELSPSRGVEETVVSEEALPEDGNSVLSIIRNCTKPVGWLAAKDIKYAPKVTTNSEKNGYRKRERKIYGHRKCR